MRVATQAIEHQGIGADVACVENGPLRVLDQEPTSVSVATAYTVLLTLPNQDNGWRSVGRP